MKRIISAVLILTMLCCMMGCSGKPESTTTTTVPTATTATSTTTTTTTTTTTMSTITTGPFNPLTGKNDMTGSSNRPVAVMITNEPGIIGNQYGIDKADFYMETEAEGAVPRMMAVFASPDRVPEKLGPVRSARTPFIATANALGAVYVYSGATSYVKEILSNTKGFHKITNDDRITLWRDDYLKQNANVSWNTLITGGKQLAAKMIASGIPNQAIKNAPFTFGEKSGSITANTVQLKSTASTNVTFIYDESTGLYGKNNGKAGSCKPQKALDGDQIKVSNVLILHAEKYVEQKNNKYTWYNFRTGDGTGYLISNGTARPIKYNRTESSLSIYEEDGSTAVFAEGKTYMFLTDKTLADDLSFS